MVALAEKHVREGEAHVAHQRRIVDRLDQHGHRQAASMARNVLTTLLRSLELSRIHLEMERAHIAEAQAEVPPASEA